MHVAIGIIRHHHHHVSVIVPLRAEDAALAADNWTRRGGGPGQRWGEPMPIEAPAGRRYWPRLTVPGQMNVASTWADVDLEVWPWDETHAEVGLSPGFAHRPSAWMDHAWHVTAAAALARLATLLVHPAASSRARLARS